MLFWLVPGGFSYLINYKKILGFRKMQEKLEKTWHANKNNFLGGNNKIISEIDIFINFELS